jgi:two-component system, NarL family, response regulator NreC
MHKIRLLVVDDHPVVRAGLVTLLGAQGDMEVVGEAEDGATGVQRALQLRPDVVVMDITMAGMDGVSATREIRRVVPKSRVLVLTMHESVEYLRQMLEVGATGYVLKKAANTELAVAIRAVHRGEIFVYPSFTRALLGDMAQDGSLSTELQHDSVEALSQRETQVLRLIAQGYTSRQIADQLFLSARTIETYRGRIMEKLNVKSRVALVRYALRHGLLNQDTADADSTE